MKKIEKLNKILLERFEKEFFVTAEPHDGPCYLLETGFFQYFGNTTEHRYHKMEQDFLVKEGYIENVKLDEIKDQLWPYTKSNAISLNDGYYRSEECVIRLNTEKPNEAQYEALVKWIDNLFTLDNFDNKLQVVTDCGTLDRFQIYDMTKVDSKYIIKKIKEYYITNELLP